MSHRISFRIHVMIFSAAAMAVVGCSGASTTIKQSKEEEHIRKIPGLVNGYQMATKKQPASLQEVRDWAVKEGKGTEEDFVSTRDKELYVIANTGMGITVCEQTGKNGKCYILAMGGVSEVSAEDAKRMVGDRQLGRGSKGQMKRGGKG
ncbi:MAG TPA: hypothetical protein VGX70_07105 [Gemmataceae bacterium]|nr:hypothetical protein [Gemmataceae bacterium]